MTNSLTIKALVTGCKGQLGTEIKELAPRYGFLDITYTDVEELNLANEDAIRVFFKQNQFDVIINCAAYTAVDLAEDNRDLAHQINSEAARILADVSREHQIRLIHVSTDYIFDGTNHAPITETEIPSPISVYGQTKMEGERHVMTLLDNAYIIRTSWVYSPHGKNFVKTIANLAAQRPELSVVSDQVGSPTNAKDLAEAILMIIDSIYQKGIDIPGIYNFTNEGVTSWFDFAHFIVRYLQLPCQVKPVKTEQYPTKAMRPKYSVLDKSKIRQNFGIAPRHWHDSLVECLQKMKTPVPETVA